MFYHEYSLTACGPLNARAAEVCRKGALIKTDEGRVRLHPAVAGTGRRHPAGGIGRAQEGRPLPLGIRAAECARTDGEARAKGVSLFDGLHIPESHATLPSCVSPATIRIMESKGFKAGKIKASANLAASLERLTMLASMVPSWRWRLDFNGCLNENDALKFWKSLPHHLKTRIDFIEDPCPFSIQSWERLVDAGMPLALDMGSDVEHQPAISSDLPIIRIVKPAREATPEYLYEPPVFTTVMDHPVGQLWAVYQAAEYYRNFLPTEIPLCGLCTHLLFGAGPLY